MNDVVHYVTKHHSCNFLAYFIPLLGALLPVMVMELMENNLKTSVVKYEKNLLHINFKLSMMFLLVFAQIWPGQVNSQFIVPTRMCFQEQSKIFIIPHLIFVSQNRFMFEYFLQQKLWCRGKICTMMVYLLESPKLSASFQEFLKSLRECTDQTFNS